MVHSAPDPDTGKTEKLDVTIDFTGKKKLIHYVYQISSFFFWLPGLPYMLSQHYTDEY